ncbi:MAG: type II toxin-antitoxin system HicA family toxin [Candidatus Paceibacterota bacterium]
MSIVPIIVARVVITTLVRAGFVVLRQKGSHVFLKNSITRKITSVPMHSGTLKKRTLLAIIKQAGLTLEQFIKLLH